MLSKKVKGCDTLVNHFPVKFEHENFTIASVNPPTLPPHPRREGLALPAASYPEVHLETVANVVPGPAAASPGNSLEMKAGPDPTPAASLG